MVRFEAECVSAPKDARLCLKPLGPSLREAPLIALHVCALHHVCVCVLCSVHGMLCVHASVVYAHCIMCACRIIYPSLSRLVREQRLHSSLFPLLCGVLKRTH